MSDLRERIRAAMELDGDCPPDYGQLRRAYELLPLVLVEMDRAAGERQWLIDGVNRIREMVVVLQDRLAASGGEETP